MAPPASAAPVAHRPLAMLSLTLVVITAGYGCTRGDRSAEPPPAAKSPTVESPAVESPAVESPAAESPAAESPAAAAQPAAASPPRAKPPGPDACFDCHPDHTDGFLSTGMGRSLYRPSARPPIEDFARDKATVKHPLTGLVYRAYIDDGGTWWQEESRPGTDYVRRVEVKWVIGSGNHTRSYLGLVDGALIQMPLTWYSRRAIWDMSPGYHKRQNFRFTRPVKPECIFCHNDLTPARDEALAVYTEPLAESISCVRCHGDGTAHVAARMAGKTPPPGQPDPDILNPKHLDTTGQLRICQQCHLQGEARVLMPGKRWDTYDPRTPLHEHMSLYVYARSGGSDFGIASHGHRLSLSKCFTATDGGLNCTACHDPHRKSDPRSHRQACLSCHQPTDCGPGHGSKPDAACADCHMRKGDTSDIPHVEFTDHFIRKTPKVDEAPPPETVELIDALAGTRTGDDPNQVALREGIAHAHIFRFHNRKKHAPIAARKLAAALDAVPDSAEGFEQLAHVLVALGDLPGAVRAFERAVALDPGIVLSRMEFADALEAMGRVQDAESQLRKAIELRPDYRQGWGNLANLLQRVGRHDEADKAYAKADALSPHLPITPNNWGHNAIQKGDFDQARAHFAEARRRDAGDPMAPFNEGTLALRTGDKVTARQRFAEAITINPDFPLPYWIRGRLRTSEGDLSGARADLERFAELEPLNPNAWVDLARVIQKSGDREAAVDVLMRGRFRLPRHPAIQQAIDTVSAGRPL